MNIISFPGDIKLFVMVSMALMKWIKAFPQCGFRFWIEVTENNLRIFNLKLSCSVEVYSWICKQYIPACRGVNWILLISFAGSTSQFYSCFRWKCLSAFQVRSINYGKKVSRAIDHGDCLNCCSIWHPLQVLYQVLHQKMKVGVVYCWI